VLIQREHSDAQIVDGQQRLFYPNHPPGGATGTRASRYISPRASPAGSTLPLIHSRTCPRVIASIPRRAIPRSFRSTFRMPAASSGCAARCFRS
jgi:hypothetical protein